ncbi:TPA: hypothetical protein ACHTCR_005533 [Pseudomonas putida]|uniref:hypothetical protein n=1 Tax=Pseudomonas TaxID=286 RepID=UPI000F412298|nr:MULTISPECIES: hypothetical protein [Pseudomonas]MCE0999198.1 hypothetical protein [Pseudomonas sp. NMI1173_11]RNF72808.1 hypothetical protein EFJ98_08920 [Pseudomonas putida]
MSELLKPTEAVPATPWQRVSITLACFIGVYAAWATFEYLGVEWMPTYEKVTEHYKARIEANREAVNSLRDAETNLAGGKLNSLPLLEKELDLIGEEYRRELASIPSKQVDVAGSALTVSVITGAVAGMLTALLGWMLEGLGACLHRKPKKQITALEVSSNVTMLPGADRKIRS